MSRLDSAAWRAPAPWSLFQSTLCVDDRRGIYTELTTAGDALLEQARPTHDATLHEAVEQAKQVPELAPLVDALDALYPAVDPAVDPAHERTAEAVPV